jgi:intracellular multiplication protein IcmT
MKMADKAFEVERAPWRNTAHPVMFWAVEGHAALPLVLWALHIRWWTFWLAVSCVVALTVIRHFGLDARSAYRLLGAFFVRALAGGRVRASAPRWERKY